MATEANVGLSERIVAFAGRLASMNRDKAFALVRKHKGTARRGVTRTTDVLIVGELGWPLLLDGRPSKSLGLAKSYGVTIASEREFLEWTGKAPADDSVRTYSAAQIASLSHLPSSVVEQLTAFGLLDCRGQRYGFRDLAAARQLAQLFGSGVALSTITRSLREIRKWLPDAALSNLKLYPASSDTILIEHMKGRTDKRGQFVLAIGASQDDPDELFEQAQAAAEAKDVAMAQRLYRKVMRIEPNDPAAAFNLGNLLRSLGRNAEAEATYRAATRADPRFAEAWYNLADMLDDQNQPEKAISCLDRALDADPDYSDAIFNLGLLHQRQDRYAEALAYWRRYLALDTQSPWALRARRGLKYCELRLANSYPDIYRRSERGRSKESP